MTEDAILIKALKKRIKILEGLNEVYNRRQAFLELRSDCLDEIRDYIIQADSTSHVIEEVYGILQEYKFVPGSSED